nr:putative two-component response transcriptional regulator [Streptomyces mirabilis]
MQEIRGLIIDDEERNQRRSKARLRTHFAKIGWDVLWDSATEPDRGQELIRDADRPYDVVLVDLLFAREDLPDLPEPRGLELIAEAKERSPRTYIIAVSSGDDTRPDLFDQARRSGAHHVFRRYEFTQGSLDNSPAAVVRAVREHLLNNGTVSTIQVEADADDPAVQSIVDEVGAPTLSQLYSRVLEAEGAEMETMRLAHLTPGASGAVVCSVAAVSPGSPVLRHVLKASRDERALAHEAEQNARAAKVFPALLLIRQRPERPVGPVNGWYALGAPLPENASTLRAWLAAEPPRRDVQDVMFKLFREGLRTPHTENRESGVPLVELLRFPSLRRRLVLQALAEFSPALTRADGGGLSDVRELTRELRSFLEEGRPLGVPLSELTRPTVTTYAHGDLHGGNVLICLGRHPTPVLIDTSAFGRLNWAADAARFGVDLLMRSIDAGVESMFFTRFATWRALASHLGTRTPLVEPDGHDTPAALAALSWLVTHLHSLCPDAGEPERAWEWHVVLAEYLLRAACHTDVPPPKRALALVAAHDQLRSATALLMS